MIPVLFEIGPVTVQSFGVMMVLAFLVPTLLLRKEVVRKGLDADLALSIAIAAAVGGIVGARVHFIIERWDQFLANPGDYIFTGMGLVWYGGLLGGAVAVIWYVESRKVSSVLIADLLAPLLALGQVFGRFGCLLSGDGDYGPPTDLPWAMSFPRGIIPTEELVHPTPIYDALILFGIFALLWKIRERGFPLGFSISLYLVLLGMGRFLTEFFRRTPEVYAGLTAAQYISMGLVLVGAILIYVSFAMNRREIAPAR